MAGNICPLYDENQNLLEENFLLDEDSGSYAVTTDIRFCVDQGHYPGGNKGVCPGYYEGNRMFTLGVYLKEELEKYEGFSAILTRKKVEDDPELDVRGKMAIQNDCQVFVSLHTNAYSSPTACGVSVIYSLKRPDSLTLAENLGKSIAALMREGDGVTYFRSAYTRTYPGTTDTDYYAVIRNAVRGNVVRYAYILEQGFHTNPNECNWLSDDDNLRALAKTEAATFAAYFGHSLKPDIPTPPGDYTTYTVVAGDTLIGIARRFGTTAAELARINNLENPNLIHPGQVLLVPSDGTPEPPETTYIEYTVQKGDTLIGIARRYDTTAAVLAEVNNLADPNLIRPGQILRIPVSGGNTPAPSFTVGEKVKIRPGVTTFADGTSMSSWVREATLYVRKIEGDVILVSTEPVKPVYTGRVLAADLVKA